MKSPIYQRALFLFSLLSLIFVTNLQAQRNINYPQLANRNQQSLVSFDRIILPGQSDSTVTLATVYNLPYSYLPFKKEERSASDKKFFGTFEMNMEVFKSNKSQLRKKEENISVQGLEPIARAFSSDTAYAKSYEQSQSRTHFLSGYLQTSLSPGIYSYILQIRRGTKTQNQTSRTRTIRLESYKHMTIGNIMLGEELVEKQEAPLFQLSKLGKDVQYAQDFYALAYIPGYKEEANYSLEISNLNTSNGDTTKVGTVFSKELTSADIRRGIRPTLGKKSGTRTHLRLSPSATNGFTYALLKIPGSQFPNATYRLTIRNKGAKSPVASTTFQTIWIDIPTSLLSLDVAIDMLRYMTDQTTIDRLSRGNSNEREQKFRSFWEKRDPTPETQFNELMAEYYRRIDYAYKNFTTQNSLGYNSDQGEIYIKFGPPNDISRKYPTNGPTTEIWSYPNRKFIFKATTGFGDFRLVSRETK